MRKNSVFQRVASMNYSKNNGRRGGTGTVLRGRYGFCLKVVSLLCENGTINPGFWQEAQSIFSYCSAIRFYSGLLKCPLPVCYWICEDDPFYLAYIEEMRHERAVETRKRHDTGCLNLFDDIRREDRWDAERREDMDSPADQEEILRDEPSELIRHLEPYQRNAYSDLRHFLGCMEIRELYDYSHSRYVPVPEKLLSDVFQKHLEADIILTYSLELAEKSLQDCLDEGKEFSANEIMLMIRQIISGILDLYDNGCAHCDIKPSNIMIWSHQDWKKEKQTYITHTHFRLTDFGSIHSEKLGSGSGTEIFFSKTEYQYLKESGLNDLECRTLMDGFALALTIYSLAAGHIPANPLVNHKIVEGKWPGQIFDAYKILYDVRESSIEKMKALNESLSLQIHEDSWWSPLKIMPCVGWAPPFEKMLVGDDGIKYGRFYEQIRFSPVFDPIMIIEGGMNAKMKKLRLNEKLWTTMPRPLLLLYSDLNFQEGVVFHAPDDARTLKRATSFDGYVPCSLANTVPTDDELENILQMGDLCNQEIINTGKKFRFLLPSAKDIVRIDSEWKILWFCGKSHNLNGFDFREYFYQLYVSIKSKCHENNLKWHHISLMK